MQTTTLRQRLVAVLIWSLLTFLATPLCAVIAWQTRNPVESFPGSLLWTPVPIVVAGFSYALALALPDQKLRRILVAILLLSCWLFWSTLAGVIAVV